MKLWYMVAATSGREDKAVELLNFAIRKQKREAEFGEILVPVQNETKLVRGKKATIATKVFPGYVFIEMDLKPETQSLVQSIKFISHFVGTANKPTPVTPQEIEKIKGRQAKTLLSPEINHGLEEGLVVKVLDGPFKDFTGKVDKVSGAKVTVIVEVFGRGTPVELSVTAVMKLV
jgi:transcriptional antiterminator NusG